VKALIKKKNFCILFIDVLIIFCKQKQPAFLIANLNLLTGLKTFIDLLKLPVLP